MIADSSRLSRLPVFTGNTPTYNDEGTATTGWTETNVILSNPSASVMRITQNVTGSPTTAIRTVTMPVTNKDWVLYGKFKARQTAGDVQIIQLRGTGTLRAHLYINHNTVTSTNVIGTLSLRYTSGAGVSSNVVCATGVDTANNWTEFAMHFDSKFLKTSLFFRQTDGSWLFAGHTTGSYFASDLGLQASNGVSASCWLEFDYLTLTAADLCSIGDSICAGYNLFDPNQGAGLTNGASTWQRWAPVYTTRRNTLIVNKGVGSNTSTLVAGRIQADALDNLPKVVFLGACNNDNGAGISLATRTSNIQSSINAIIAAGAKAVLINAVYLTSAHASSPGSRAYSEQWWKEYRCTLTGDRRDINIMEAVKESSGYQDPAYTQSDGVHPNVAGYTRYGNYIAGKRLT